MLLHWSEDCTSLVKNEISKFLEDPYLKLTPDACTWEELVQDKYLPIYADIGGVILLNAETGELQPFAWDDELEVFNKKIERDEVLFQIELNALFLATNKFPVLFDALHYLFNKKVAEVIDHV